MTVSTMTAAAATSFLALDDDWDVVVAALSSSSEHRLAARAQIRVRELADGFGALRGPMTDRKMDLIWDWSHVRDSSDAAVARMASLVRRMAARVAGAAR